MIKFYKRIDMRSRKAMTEFLTKHFRYNTANSWNGSTSYACNMKIYRLGLDSDIVDKLYDMLNAQEFFDEIDELLSEFNEEHNYLWQARMNGRGGGYLVLYNGKSEPSQYKSYCTKCGQRNYTSVKDTSKICGRCYSPARVDYITPPMMISVYPCKGTDQNEDFADWDMRELRERVRLVQEFDSLADRIVERAIELAKQFRVVDEEFFVPQTRKVLEAV